MYVCLLRVLNQYGTHWNKNTPTTAMIHTVGQLNSARPSDSTFLPCLSLPSKSHRENSISSIFLESPHQVDMKNVVKFSKRFFGCFNTLETHSV